MPQCSILQQRLSKETSKETQETMSEIIGRKKLKEQTCENEGESKDEDKGIVMTRQLLERLIA